MGYKLADLVRLPALRRRPDGPCVRSTPYAAKKMFVHEESGIAVAAYTRSEARALLKKELGLPRKGRLPAGAKVIYEGELLR